MLTECSAERFDFGIVEGRAVEAAFDAGLVTSDAGALLLGTTDRAIDLVDRFAGCFRDYRCQGLIEHTVATLVGQRVFAIALGYEDLNDHDELRHDPMMAVLAGKLTVRRPDCAPVAGKSTLNRLELSRAEPSRYPKIAYQAAAIEALPVTLFLEAHARPPKQIILDLDATDDPLHGHQEGRFFHGYYDCYCYLPLYVFCGRQLLAAKLRPSDIDASAGCVAEADRIVRQIRARWPHVRILLRADSGFAREALMTWCEQNRVDYVFGLARNARLVAMIEAELAQAKATAEQTGRPARRFKDFKWSTLNSWSRRRRVVGKAEWTQGEANPRFVVTSLKSSEAGARYLYQDIYCAPRRHGEPHQGMPARSLCRSHFGGHSARQPAAVVVRLHGLCAALRAASHRPRRNRFCRCHLRHHQAQALEDRRDGARLHAPHQDRHGIGVPGRRRVGSRRPPPGRRCKGPRLARLTRAAATRYPRHHLQAHGDPNDQNPRSACGATIPYGLSRATKSALPDRSAV